MIESVNRDGVTQASAPRKETSMTLDEFLDDYVPRVLRPMGGWVTGGAAYCPLPAPCRCVRRKSQKFWGDACPLTAEKDHRPEHWAIGAAELGLSLDDAKAIVAASDLAVADLVGAGKGVEPDPVIRARLLAGLGLSDVR